MKTNEDVLVTIGIPFYNAEKFIENAILSIINQTFTQWELILLDDGSTDNSLNIVFRYANGKIKILSDGENRGLPYRLNQSVSLANGLYYSRMDADDIMHIERLKIQVEYLKNHSEVDVVGSGYYSIDIENKVIGKKNINSNPNTIKNVLQADCFAHPSIMGKTQWFKNNPYNENCRRMEDFELWIRTVEVSNFKNIFEPLLFYRCVDAPLKKYIQSNFGVIKILQKRARYKLDIEDFVYYTGIYLFKIIVYFVFSFFGQVNFLIEKRTNKMSPDEAMRASEILLNSIKKNK